MDEEFAKSIRADKGIAAETKAIQARPVIAVEDAVRVELEAIAWRDGLKRNRYPRESHRIHFVSTGDTLGARKTCNKAANTQMEPRLQTVMQDHVVARAAHLQR